MKITSSHIVLPIVCILVGTVLVYLGLCMGWGLVWVAGGGFFIVVGIGAGLLTSAWTLPGRVGAFLRRPFVGILILIAVILMMVITVYIGISS